MPCFRNELISKISETKGRQFYQAGIEILGTDNINSDLEVLLLAHKGFTLAGIPSDNVLIRMGSVELFNRVCSETGMSESDILIVKDLMDTIAESRAGKMPERLKPSIDQALNIVKEYKPTTEIMAKWKKITNTYVDEINKSFIDVVGHDDIADSLNYLASVARSHGLRCVIDPSVVRSHEYYTGIVYEIDIKTDDAVLVEVAGGGRYNKLIGKFFGKERSDVSVPAVGFAYGLERIITIFQHLQSTEKLKLELNSRTYVDTNAADVVIFPTKNLIDEKILKQAEVLRGKGKRVDIYVGDDTSDKYLNRYAKNLGAKLLKL